MRDAISGLISLPLAAIPAVFLGIASCATTADTAPPVHGSMGGMCTGDGLDQFVGREATEEVGAEILRLSGADRLRWVAEGMKITMDYRGDRVTAYLDRENRIEKIYCG